MSIVNTDLKLFKSATIGDTSSNGGKETVSEIISGQLNNVFPNVTNAERLAGVVRYRKMFLRNINANSEKFEVTQFWIDFLSTADDFHRIIKGIFNDTQGTVVSDYDGGETWSGSLTGSVIVGDSVTGAVSGATATVLAISGSSIRLLVLSGIFVAEAVELNGSNFFTTTGTGTFRDGFVGTGRLNSAITAGQSSMQVNFFDDDVRGRIQPGAKIIITDKETVNDVVNDTEDVVVDTLTWAGSIATINIVGTFQNSYAVSFIGTGGVTFFTRIAPILDIGDLVATFDTFVKNLPTGDYTETLLQPENEGSEEDTITITFTSTTDFSVTGVENASYGSGDVSTDFAPINANTNTPYFTVPAAGWSGTFTSTETFSFKTHPSAQGIWVRETVPVATAAFTNNKTWVAVKGDSAVLTTTTTTTTSTTTTTTSTSTTTTTSTSTTTTTSTTVTTTTTTTTT